MRIIKKLLIAFGIVAIVLCLVVVVVVPMMFPKTSGIHIERLCYDYYIELTEEDLDKHPVLREALERKDLRRRRFHKVPVEKGIALSDYLSQRQREVAPPHDLYLAYFKYKGDFYGFNMRDAFVDNFAVIDIYRLYLDHYVKLTEEDLDKHPVLRKALKEMERQGKESIIYKIPYKEGIAIYKDLFKRYMTYFKYEGRSYRFRLII